MQKMLTKICQIIIDFTNHLGIAKVNMACDWVWHQDEEKSSLRKYKKH